MNRIFMRSLGAALVATAAIALIPGHAAAQTDAGCQCSGTGIDGAVTVDCGGTTCGTDDNTYVCNSPGGDDGWAFQSSGCGDAGGGDDAGETCTCTGTGLSGPVTVDCGSTTCGTDSNTYMCNSPGGSDWSFVATGCAGGCSCSGTGASGPVTVNCGQTTCGTDDNTYICDSPGGNDGWAFQASGCSAAPDSGASCSCSGSGASGPVTVNCGQTTCGEDDNTYVCNSPGGNDGWAFSQSGCVDACVPITTCGQGQNCGTISDGCGGTVTCGSSCSDPNNPVCQDNVCSCGCTGTGINGQVTVACGQTTCGTDSNTYTCNSPGGPTSWTFSASGCP